MAPFARIADTVITRIERARPLDRPGYRLGEMVALPFRLMGGRGKRVRNLLHGTGFGHSLHPLLVTLPIGAWTASLLFDLMHTAARPGHADGAPYATGADLSITAGCLGAAGAAVTGLVDWNKTHGEPRRLGLVHGATNGATLALYLTSLALRRRDRRPRAKAVSILAFASLFAGSYMGGHLVHRRNVSTDHADRNRAPREFMPVLPEAALREGAPRLVEADGVRIVLVRNRGRIHALGDRCSHFGGPLSQGWVFQDGLVCPWHGSRYCLHSGRPLDGPATAVQPRFEVRVRDGMIQLRRPAVRRPADLPAAARPVAPAAPADSPAPRADEVLFGHHQMLRRLFHRIATTHPHDPRRLDLLDELAGEMDMHEKIEHEIFYPAARRVTDQIPVAGAEHRQLADQLATLLSLDPAGPAFEENLAALRAALEHHAGSEERDMFIATRRLGDGELRRLGAALEQRLESLRRSRTRKLIRLGRQVLLERGRGRIDRAMAAGG